MVGKTLESLQTPDLISTDLRCLLQLAALAAKQILIQGQNRLLTEGTMPPARRQFKLCGGHHTVTVCLCDYRVMRLSQQYLTSIIAFGSVLAFY